MERLFHLSTTPKQMELFDEDWEEIKRFVEKQNMDGIEIGLTQTYPLEKIPKEIITGVHLSFYPMWIDFFRQDKEKLSKLFKTEEEIIKYYGGSNPEILIHNYKVQYERAKALGAKYMVFHVCHILPEDSFTFKYDYTDKEVFEETLNLVNAAFDADEDGPMLLFENLWWPGLTYLDKNLAEDFINRVKYKNKGYLVDISHLILTNKEIGNEYEAYKYISKVYKELGNTSKWIKGIHLNKTLPKVYMKRDHSYALEQYKGAKDSRQKQMILKKHINQMDGHKPFDHPIAKKIVDLIKPTYCVYETSPSSRYELAYFIKKQNEALKD